LGLILHYDKLSEYTPVLLMSFSKPRGVRRVVKETIKFNNY